MLGKLWRERKKWIVKAATYSANDGYQHRYLAQKKGLGENKKEMKEQVPVFHV